MDRRNSKPKVKARKPDKVRLNLGTQPEPPKRKRVIQTFVLRRPKPNTRICPICGIEMPPGRARSCITCHWKAKEIPDDAD